MNQRVFLQNYNTIVRYFLTQNNRTLLWSELCGNSNSPYMTNQFSNFPKFALSNFFCNGKITSKFSICGYEIPLIINDLSAPIFPMI